jgi:hypothetical protein
LTVDEYMALPKDTPINNEIGSIYRPTNEKTERIYKKNDIISYFEIINKTEKGFESILKFTTLE